MTRRNPFNKMTIIVVLLAFTFGCTTTRPLSSTSPQALARSVSIGDEIEIVRLDGSRLGFEVTEVSQEGIGGSDVFVPYSDMQQVSRIQVNVLRTGVFVLLTVGLLYVLEKNFESCPIYWPDPECDDD